MIEMIQGNIRIIELLKMLTQGFIWRNLYDLSRILLHFPGISLTKKNTTRFSWLTMYIN